MDILGEENINKSLSVHYLIYRIENTVNKKYYVGQHITDNPYDKYMGSGFLLKRAQCKYGLSAFTKEILFDFDNFEDMNAKEMELIPLSACYPIDPMSYNLQRGGYAGIRSEISNKKIAIAQKQIWKNKTDEERNKLKEIISKANSGKNNPMYGKSITDIMSDDQIIEWKRKLGERTRALWQNDEYRKKVLSQTLQKSGLSHDCRQYMTDEQIAKWKENIGKCISGKTIQCTEKAHGKNAQKNSASSVLKNLKRAWLEKRRKALYETSQ